MHQSQAVKLSLSVLLVHRMSAQIRLVKQDLQTRLAGSETSHLMEVVMIIQQKAKETLVDINQREQVGQSTQRSTIITQRELNPYVTKVDMVQGTVLGMAAMLLIQLRARTPTITTTITDMLLSTNMARPMVRTTTKKPTPMNMTTTIPILIIPMTTNFMVATLMMSIQVPILHSALVHQKRQQRRNCNKRLKKRSNRVLTT